jgi:NAD(P)-dependent dehydrogenase (short-subunit alcohol dehydrogenase family)
LGNKVAIVTGGSAGIGKATAQRLAAEGASVVIAARRKEQLDCVVEEIASAGGRVVSFQADVRQSEQCVALVERTISTFGRLDILVNNAGTSARSAFESVTDEAWTADFELKLFSAIRLARLSIPHMRKQGGGRIINVTSIGGKQPGPASVPTSVTRAAGLALTKALSKEFAPDGILVNTVCIGLVRSQQHETKATAAGIPIEALYTQFADKVPLGRVGRADEVANMIAFLASEAASFITGTSINLDGGASAVL